MGGTALMRYNYLYLLLLSAPVCLMLLRVVISLFLRLVVGSLLITL